jgi:hypothetical protein
MKSHDFVGPFKGLRETSSGRTPVAINLCRIESISADSDATSITFCGTQSDAVYVFMFDTIEHYTAALHTLRVRGVSLPLPEVKA